MHTPRGVTMLCIYSLFVQSRVLIVPVGKINEKPSKAVMDRCGSI